MRRILELTYKVNYLGSITLVVITRVRSRLKNRKIAIFVILLLIIGTGLASLYVGTSGNMVGWESPEPPLGAAPREAPAGGVIPPPRPAREAPAEILPAPALAPAPGSPPKAAVEKPLAPLQQQAAEDRMVVTTASMKINVTSVIQAVADLRRIAESSGGFVTDSSFEPIPKGRVADEGVLIQPSARASLTMRIPSDQLDGVISRISSLGELLSLRTNSKDVTEQYSDTNARLKNAQAVLAQYKEIMKTAKTTVEVLQIQQRIDAVQEQIEVLTGQIRRLQNQVSLATITMSLIEPQLVKKPTDEDGKLLDRLLLQPLSIALSLAEIVFRGVIILVIGLFPVYTIGGLGYFTYRRLWKKPKKEI